MVPILDWARQWKKKKFIFKGLRHGHADTFNILTFFFHLTCHNLIHTTIIRSIINNNNNNSTWIICRHTDRGHTNQYLHLPLHTLFHWSRDQHAKYCTSSSLLIILSSDTFNIYPAVCCYKINSIITQCYFAVMHCFSFSIHINTSSFWFYLPVRPTEVSTCFRTIPSCI